MLPIINTTAFEFAFFLSTIWILLVISWRTYKVFVAQSRTQRSMVDLINAELPQTQCGQCGHSGCLPYAEAISTGAAINKCPPGGDGTIRRLARLLNQPIESVDAAHGIAKPQTLAVIREAECIGCTKCIVACPVDAILGAPKLMHTVIAEECTGCDLCVAPCPVDCIDMITVSPRTYHWATSDNIGLSAAEAPQETAPC